MVESITYNQVPVKGKTLAGWFTLHPLGTQENIVMEVSYLTQLTTTKYHKGGGDFPHHLAHKLFTQLSRKEEVTFLTTWHNLRSPNLQ